jgi:hypothetical protein
MPADFADPPIDYALFRLFLAPRSLEAKRPSFTIHIETPRAIAHTFSLKECDGCPFY